MINFQEYIPDTLDDAISIIYQNLDPSEKDSLKKYGHAAFHHGFGTSLRNGWGLWNKDSKLHQFFNREYELGHADDMSALILKGVEYKCRGEVYDPYHDVELFRKHWIAYGIDPLTQENLDNEI